MMGPRDWVEVAVGIGTLLALAISTSQALRRDKRDEESEVKKDVDKLWQTMNLHLIECARANGAGEEAVKGLKVSLDRLARQVSQLQAQLRLATTGGANKLFTDQDTSGGSVE